MELKKFSEWIEKNGRTKIGVAKQLGICSQYLWRIMRGYNVASESLAVEIEALTNGAIPSSYIRPPIQPRPRCPTCGCRIKKSLESDK